MNLKIIAGLVALAVALGGLAWGFREQGKARVAAQRVERLEALSAGLETALQESLAQQALATAQAQARRRAQIELAELKAKLRAEKENAHEDPRCLSDTDAVRLREYIDSANRRIRDAAGVR